MTGQAWWAVAAVAALHFVVQVAALLAAVGRGMARFDQGGEPGIAERLVDGAATLLQFPLVLLARSLPIGGTGQWGWLILLANSALWGVAVIGVWRVAARRRGAVVRGAGGQSAVVP